MFVAPIWPTQPWFPEMLKLLVSPPVVLPVSKDLLLLASRSTVYPKFLGKSPRPRSFKESCETIIAAWKLAYKSQYTSALKKWNQFCIERKINPHSVSVLNGLDFLQCCFNKGMSYSAIGTARSALSFVFPRYNCGSFGEHFQVKKFMTGVYKLRTPSPRYHATWDVKVVFN